MNADFVATIALGALTASLAIVYSLRVLIKGRVHFDRVEKEGKSVFISKSLMEFAHWSTEPLARGLAFCRITPNQVSWSSLFFGMAAGVCLAEGRFGLGAALSFAAALFDLLDGMLARMTGKASDAGEVLDAAIDRYVEFFFLGGLAIFYRNHIELELVTLAALLGSFMVSYSTAKAEALHVTPPRGSMRRTERAAFLVGGALASSLTSNSIGVPMISALVIVGVLSNISAAQRFWEIAKQVRAKK
jgi:phosphatidylglycerophosphate synthase